MLEICCAQVSGRHECKNSERLIECPAGGYTNAMTRSGSGQGIKCLNEAGNSNFYQPPSAIQEVDPRCMAPGEAIHRPIFWGRWLV